MNAPGNRHPIFVHALFRSASTYFFQAFRRLGEDYTCFHEPLHELALQAQQDPELLNNDQDAGKAGALRHPTLNRPYFAELYAIAGEALPRLHESDIYDGYFGSTTDCRGLDYWRALVEHAPGRPVIQECRAAARMGAIRHNLGGCHVYIWRNPWDQWWSYQVSPYFDLTTQLILNATPTHPVVERLIEHIGFTPVHGTPLHVAYDWFEHRPLAPRHSYQAFYALWLLALQQAQNHADLLINIDELSADLEARKRTEQWFAGQGFAGLDLSDCHSPVTLFCKDEQARLEELEGEVHRLWAEAGMAEQALEQLLALRTEKAPRRNASRNKAAWCRELARYRELVTNRQQVMNERLQNLDARMQAGHRREDELREWVQRVEAQNEAKRWYQGELRARVEQLEQDHEAERRQGEELRGRIEQLELENEAERRNTEAERGNAEALLGRIAERDALIHSLYQSRSWRMTAPLRDVSTFIRLLRAHGPRFALARALTAAERRSRSYPRLRRRLWAFVSRIPGIAGRLRRLRHRHQHPEQQRQPPAPQLLTPRAREIHSQLRAEIDRLEGTAGESEHAHRH